MRMLQSILLATDFRPASKVAGEVAVQLAGAFGASVTLLHVVEPMPSWPVTLHQAGEQAASLLEQFAEQLTAQKAVIAESSIVGGHPADTIVRKAQEIDADLILIGAGESSQFDRFSVGRVAEAVIELAPQPVLLVRPGKPVAKLSNILCPVDHSTASRRGLRNAIQLAKVFGSRLVVLSVVPEVSWLTAAVETGEVTDVKAEYEQQWCEELENFLADVSFQGVPHTKEIRSGVPHEQIVAAAKEHETELIVMGATGRTGLVRILLGSTTRRVLRDLPCSLLTVKQEDVVEELFEADLRIIELLMAEARALSAAGSHEPVVAKCRQVLARNPFHGEALECLAEAHEKLGQVEEAETYRRRVKRLRKQD